MAVVAMVAAGCGNNTEGPAATEVIELVPVDQFGELEDGWAAEERVTGECFTASLVSDRADAFRCMTVDSSIHDPCFAAAEADVLACNPDPWDTTALLLEASAMPWDDLSYQASSVAPVPAAERQPWALEVEAEDGEAVRCGPISGTSTSVAGRRVNFGCDRDGWDLLDISRGVNGTWTVERPDEGRIVTVRVLRAWV